jgi:hypothetical protein
MRKEESDERRMHVWPLVCVVHVEDHMQDLLLQASLVTFLTTFTTTPLLTDLCFANVEAKTLSFHMVPDEN